MGDNSLSEYLRGVTDTLTFVFAAGTADQHTLEKINAVLTCKALQDLEEAICDDHLKKGLRSEGYKHIRIVDGKYCGILRMTFTVGVFINLDRVGHDGRFCFNTYANAKRFLADWDGKTRPIVGEDGCTADKYYPKSTSQE